MQTGHTRDIHIGDRHDRRGVVALAVVAVALVAAIVVIAVVALAAPDTVEGSAVPRGRPTGSPTGSPTEAAEADPSREVTLYRGTGIDLDSDATRGSVVEGATGEVDLFLESYNLLRSRHGEFFEDSGPGGGARERCAAAVGGAKAPLEAVIPAAVGAQYCLTTSGGRTAWLRVNATTLDSLADAQVVFDVVVW